MWLREKDDDKEERKFSSYELVKKISPFFKPYLYKFLFVFILLLISLSGNLAGPLILREIIDKAIPEKSVNDVLLLAALFTVIFTISMAISYFQVIITTKIGLEIVKNIKTKVFKHLLTLSMSYFDKNPSGKLMARVESDSEKIKMLFSNIAIALIQNLLMVIGTITIMFITSKQITFSILLLMFPVTILTFFFLKIIRKYFRKVRVIFSQLAGFIAEYTRAVPILQTFMATDMAYNKINLLGRNFLKKEMQAYGLEYSFWSFIRACEIISIIIILISSKSGIFTGLITIGTVILFVEYTRRLFMPLMQFSETLNQIQRAFASADRIFDILHTKTKTPDGHLEEDEFPKNWGKIEFKNIWFKYKDDWILKDINFSIERGQRVALVGHSGGGKTTIISLLLRFYDPTKGEILFDNINIKKFSLSIYRRKIASVLQDVNLFSGTLSENLTVFNPNISKEIQINALRKISALNILENLPKGLDTEIAEGGINLSMGQRQLLCFARAIIYNPDIFILDEATSSVDPGTEKKIQKASNLLTVGRTSIIIAHRLSTIVSSDKIIVINEGLIIEEGKHKDLIKREGFYNNLYQLQFGE